MFCLFPSLPLELGQTLWVAEKKINRSTIKFLLQEVLWLHLSHTFSLINILAVISVTPEPVICLLGKAEGEGGDTYPDFLHHSVVVFGHHEGIIPLWGSRGFQLQVHAEHVPVGVDQGELKQSLHGSQSVLKCHTDHIIWHYKLLLSLRILIQSQVLPVYFLEYHVYILKLLSLKNNDLFILKTFFFL